MFALSLFLYPKEKPGLVRMKKPTAVSLSLKINRRQRRCRRRDPHVKG